MITKIIEGIKGNLFEVSFSILFTFGIEFWLFGQLEARNYQGIVQSRFEWFLVMSIPVFFIFFLLVLEDIEKFKSSFARTARYLMFVVLLLPIGFEFSFFHMILALPFVYFGLYYCYNNVKESYKKNQKVLISDILLLSMIPGFILLIALLGQLNVL